MNVKADVGIVLDTTQSVNYLNRLERFVAFKANFAKETSRRKEKLDDVRTQVATASKSVTARVRQAINEAQK